MIDETAGAAALTDEALAWIEGGHVAMKTPFATPDICRRCSHYWPCPTSRLIAALRASRAEVERLSEQGDGLYQATLMLGAEVERLRAEHG